jgi:hypothetical protein
MSKDPDLFKKPIIDAGVDLYIAVLEQAMYEHDYAAHQQYLEQRRFEAQDRFQADQQFEEKSRYEALNRFRSGRGFLKSG